jgi:hypothetical protein
LRSVGGDDLGVVHEPVDHRGGHDVVAEHLAPAMIARPTAMNRRAGG